MSDAAPTDGPTAELWAVRAGTVGYADACGVQAALAAARQAGRIPDVLLLLEHPPVYTRGRRSTADELPMGEEWYRRQGIEVATTDRGGRATYHGPGQLVGYPIVSLRPYRDDVHAYLRRLEAAMIAALGDRGVAAEVNPGLTGVWVAAPDGQARKIASIGVHVSRGVTTHGFAINVNNDLQPFEWIVPCGIENCRVTSLCRELGAEQDLPSFARTVRDRFAEECGRRAVEVAAGEVAERVDGLDALAAAAAPAEHAAAVR